MSATVLIAGGGLAAQRCAETLRRSGHGGPIRMMCAELHRPYDRPPLSKQLLHGAWEPERRERGAAVAFMALSVETNGFRAIDVREVQD